MEKFEQLSFTNFVAFKPNSLQKKITLDAHTQNVNERIGGNFSMKGKLFSKKIYF